MRRGKLRGQRIAPALALLLVVAAGVARAAPPEVPPTTAVVFGATGDLARRKVFPALLSAWRAGKLPDDFKIVAAGRDKTTREAFLARLRDGMRDVGGVDVAGDPAWRELEKRIEYAPVDLSSADSVHAFGKALDDIDGTSGRQRLLYLAVTPSVLEDAAVHLGRGGLLSSRDGREPLLLVEKPFGRDTRSARRLNRALAKHISLQRVMRMDHYLGKPAIEDLRRLRASDPAFARVWNRNYISRVEITASEKIGIEGRGAFYEETGALRDFAQGHLVQSLAVTAMEPEADATAEGAKSDVLRALRPLSPDRDVIRGQYEGYRDEPGVAADSSVETYVAIKAHIDNDRWRDVPFLLESGKQLAEKRSAIRVHFRRLSPELARRFGVRANQPATLEVAIDPEPGIWLTSGGRRMSVVDAGKGRPDAYERLLLGAMRGERALFVGGPEVERAWAWLEPVQKRWRRQPKPIATYARGSARPAVADPLFARPGGKRASERVATARRLPVRLPVRSRLRRLSRTARLAGRVRKTVRPLARVRQSAR